MAIDMSTRKNKVIKQFLFVVGCGCCVAAFSGCAQQPSKPQQPLSQTELESRIRDIQNNPNIPTNQKQQAVDELRHRAKG
jgi:hypothetical protein